MERPNRLYVAPARSAASAVQQQTPRPVGVHNTCDIGSEVLGEGRERNPLASLFSQISGVQGCARSSPVRKTSEEPPRRRSSLTACCKEEFEGATSYQMPKGQPWVYCRSRLSIQLSTRWIVRPLIVSFSLPAARVPEGAAQWSKIDHRFPANLKPTGRTGPGTTVGTTRRP